MISIEKKERCCGCTSCYTVCPKKCIHLEKDEEGFSYPVVDKEKCINCGLCEKICPIINVPEVSTRTETYAAQNKEKNVRQQSTSGGMFFEFAKKIIKDGGYVCGAGSVSYTHLTLPTTPYV